jgi:hypothetical protein
VWLEDVELIAIVTNLGRVAPASGSGSRPASRRSSLGPGRCGVVAPRFVPGDLSCPRRPNITVVTNPGQGEICHNGKVFSAHEKTPTRCWRRVGAARHHCFSPEASPSYRAPAHRSNRPVARFSSSLRSAQPQGGRSAFPPLRQPIGADPPGDRLDDVTGQGDVGDDPRRLLEPGGLDRRPGHRQHDRLVARVVGRAAGSQTRDSARGRCGRSRSRGLRSVPWAHSVTVKVPVNGTAIVPVVRRGRADRGAAEPADTRPGRDREGAVERLAGERRVRPVPVPRVVPGEDSEPRLTGYQSPHPELPATGPATRRLAACQE